MCVHLFIGHYLCYNLGITDVRYTYITTYLCTFRNSTLDVTEPVQTPPIDFVIQNETVSYRYICLRQHFDLNP